MYENLWKEVKKIPRKELVDRQDWQKLRESLVGTWKDSCKENTRKLINFINQHTNKSDFCERVLIVFNYLTSSYFRINTYRLCKEVKDLRKRISETVREEKYTI